MAAPVSSIPDELEGIMSSFFQIQNKTREMTPPWTSLDNYLTENVLVPLDVHIQEHLQTNARDRMQGTVKQRKQGHKKADLPFTAATERDIRNFSAEYKEVLETEVFPKLLKDCLTDVEKKMVDKMVLLLRSEDEIAQIKVEWLEDESTFDTLYERHVTLQDLSDEYEIKKECVDLVNERTKLISEITNYHREQISPYSRDNQFSHDNYCPPQKLYRSTADKIVMKVIDQKVESALDKWERANGDEFVVREERYLETMEIDIWEEFTGGDPKKGKKNSGMKQKPSLGARRLSGGMGGRKSSGKAGKTPTKVGAGAKKPAAGAKKPAARTPNKPGAKKAAPEKPAKSRPSAKGTAAERIAAEEAANAPAPLPEPVLIMDRPISHVRAKRDLMKFDPMNKSGGRRVIVSEESPDVDPNEPYIKVACRIRPMLGHEGGIESVLALEDGKTIKLDRGKKAPVQFKMHYTANHDIKQLEFYQTCQIVPLIDRSMNGHHVTVFAYGQTGSGKTHTIAGPEEVIALHEGVRLNDPEGKVATSVKDVLRECLRLELLDHGLMPRGSRYLFDQIVQMEAEDPNVHFDVRCTYTEIYNEAVYDLLGKPNSDPLEMKMNTGSREGFYVADLTEIDAKTTDDVMRIFMDGAKNRQVSAHQLNKESSRSHALFSMIVDKKTWNDKDGTLWVTRGKLTLVDLAGSESIKTTGTTGKGLLETQGINTSLLHLSNLVSQLAKESTAGGDMNHIPWRNSKLTMLLNESLANTGSTLMIANVSPNSEWLSESTNTLNFATKAANIVAKKVKQTSSKENEYEEMRKDVYRYKTRCDELEEENQTLKKLLDDAGIQY